MKKQLSPRQIFERSITEEDVFGACRQLLELNGARVHRVVERIPWGRKKSEPGIPDSFGWWPRGFVLTEMVTSKLPGYSLSGRMLKEPLPFFIEFKKPGGAHRPAQERWIAQACEDGIIAFFADSVEAMVKGFWEFRIQIKGV